MNEQLKKDIKIEKVNVVIKDSDIEVEGDDASATGKILVSSTYLPTKQNWLDVYTTTFYGKVTGSKEITWKDFDPIVLSYFSENVPEIFFGDSFDAEEIMIDTVESEVEKQLKAESTDMFI